MKQTIANRRASDPRHVYILLLQDEIARLKRWIDELVRMHYRLDDEETPDQG